MTQTDTDQEIENLLAVLETTRGQLQKIETDAAADESALATARSEYESARALYESQARAFGLGQTTHRPVKPDLSIVSSLAESVELRRTGGASVRTEIARLETELAQLRSARVHLEARASAAKLRTAFNDLMPVLSAAWSLAASSPDAEQAFASVGFQRAPRGLAIKLPIMPALLLHVDQLVAESVSAKSTPRFAALLESESLARDAAHDAAIGVEIEEHAAQVKHRIDTIMRPVQEIRAAADRSPDVGEVHRRQAEIERAATHQLTELRAMDATRRETQGWPEPSWSVADYIAAAPARRTEATPALGPGWASA